MPAKKKRKATKKKVKSRGRGDDDTVCGVCLGELDELPTDEMRQEMLESLLPLRPPHPIDYRVILKLLPCTHLVHEWCWSRWCRPQEGACTCPLDRRTVDDTEVYRGPMMNSTTGQRLPQSYIDRGIDPVRFVGPRPVTPPERWSDDDDTLSDDTTETETTLDSRALLDTLAHSPAREVLQSLADYDDSYTTLEWSQDGVDCQEAIIQRVATFPARLVTRLLSYVNMRPPSVERQKLLNTLPNKNLVPIVRSVASMGLTNAERNIIIQSLQRVEGREYVVFYHALDPILHFTEEERAGLPQRLRRQRQPLHNPPADIGTQRRRRTRRPTPY